MTPASFFQQWQDLHRRSPATWPGHAQATLLMFVMLAILFAGWHLHLQPAIKLQQNNTRTVQQLTASYADKYRQAATLTSLQKQEQSMSAHLAHLERQLSVEEEIATALDDIGEAAQQHHLHLDLARPGSPDNTTGLTRRPIVVHLAGNYHDIGRFAADLAAMPRLLVLSNMRLIAGDRPGMTILDADILAFFRQLSDDGMS